VRRAVAVLGVVAVLAGSGVAIASWGVGGSGSARARAGAWCTSGSATVVANADTYVRSGSVNQNNGSAGTFQAQAESGDNNRALLRFPLPTIPPGCSLTQATIVLVRSSFSGATAPALQSYVLSGAFVESSVTWANCTGGAGCGTTGSAFAFTGGATTTWSPTAQVATLYQNGNTGLMIRYATEGGSTQRYAWVSREGTAANRPRLTIWWA